MALDPLYVTSINLDEFFINQQTGEPLANGSVEFWRDDNRAVGKNVFEITGAPPNYTYTELPNPLNLNATGNPIGNNGQNTSIYYYPYDANGNIELYYIVVKDSDGVVQFTRQGWPNTTEGLEGVINVTVANVVLASGNTYIINNGAVQVDLSLPLAAPIGSVYTIIGNSSGGWTVSQNAGQRLHFGNQSTTLGGGGSLTSSHRYDCITIRCVATNAEFVCYAAQGNLTVV